MLLVVTCGAVLGITRQQQPAPTPAAPGTNPAIRSNAPATPAKGKSGTTSQAPQSGDLAVEALLYRSMREIGDNRLDVALNEIGKVIGTYPNFRLAHLIKGDLLLARRQPITTIGNASDAPREQIEALRDEARVRLARYQQARPRSQVPLNLIQLDPDQRHAIVVDTSISTLYLFENHDGVPRYVADYYATIGRNGTDKNREGDQKTPLGVYHVTKSIPREKLAEFYGAGAFPISYPNEWDRRQGRDGHGIWLHGTPPDTYSRPPRASDGCVVLTNEDFKLIAGTVRVGITPVIITDHVRWVATDGIRSLRAELLQQVDSWRRDWESRDTERYLRHYAASFTTGTLDRAEWETRKRAINAKKKWINLKLHNVSMYLYPGRDDLAVVTFDQDYASSNLQNRMRKRQYWMREGDAWRIVHEGAA